MNDREVADVTANSPNAAEHTKGQNNVRADAAAEQPEDQAAPLVANDPETDHADADQLAPESAEPETASADTSAPPVEPEAVEPESVLPESVGTEPETADTDKTEQQDTMHGLLTESEQDMRTLQRGEVVQGIIVSVDRDGILIDVGLKSEGVIPASEAQQLVERGEVSVGDEVLVFVVQPEMRDGNAILSIRRARSERGWRQMQQQFEEGQIFEAKVVDFNKGGLIVNVEGVRGFVPMSQIAGVRVNDANEDQLKERLGGMVGQTVVVKVLEINRKRNRLILSERQAAQERRVLRKEQLINELHEGEVRHGKVSSLCDFGAFVDLGGADGLIHLSELSWSQVSHPKDVLSVGEELDVYVLGVDRERKKIALSLRRLLPEPWATAADRYKPGELVTGTITKLATFGAFARIEDGIEGLIHISELSDARVPHPKNVVKEGDVLTLRVLRVDADRKRLGLSLRQVEQSGGDEESLD